ncbi:hypothetical protein DFH09DRAFT_1099835 [Mycena vulgaris]|nr:hypothetical protein DFH09DRAFT_1099835 [Mycena vulgaris]
MAPVPPEGLTTSALITAKGAELKFWIIKTNEAAEKKALNLRTNLAAYYGLDLTVNPRVDIITAPTVDESIRDRQWADLLALGVEWKETVKAGGVFKLVKLTSDSRLAANPILVAAQSSPDDGGNIQATLNTSLRNTNGEDMPSRTPFNMMDDTDPNTSNHPVSPPVPTPGGHIIPGASAIQYNNQSLSPIGISSTCQLTMSAAGSTSTLSQREAAILEDLSRTIDGLQRCEGLRDVIQQIESGAVQKIRDRYGPSEYGRRGTADPAWSKYSNLVSKRERLYRILTQDFGGDKERFFRFFSVPPTSSKKRKRPADEPTSSEEHFRSFRKMVEAIPWCDADLVAERQKDHFLGPDGEFAEALWMGKWTGMNSWEIWREIGRERYVKEKVPS